VSSWFSYHGALHPMDDTQGQVYILWTTAQGRATLVFPHQLPLCLCVVRLKNVLYPSLFFLPSLFFVLFFLHVFQSGMSIMAFRFSRQMPRGLS